MSEKLLFLIIGGLIGFFSSLATVFLNHYLIDRRETKKKASEEASNRKSQLITNMTEIAELKRELFKSEQRLERRASSEEKTEEKTPLASHFRGGMSVVLQDGSSKEIRDLNVNDAVLTYNTKGERVIAKKLISIVTTGAIGSISINGHVFCKSHVFVTKHRARPAALLRLGDEIQVANGDPEIVHSLSVSDDSEAVDYYELSIDGGGGISVDGYVSGLSIGVTRYEKMLITGELEI